MLRAKISILCLTLAFVAAACRGDAAAPAADPERERFVETYVELRRAVVEFGGEPMFEERKREILARHRTDEERLREFIRRHEHDPQYLSALWSDIVARSAEVTPR